MIKPKVIKKSLTENVGSDNLVRQEFVLEHPDKEKDFRTTIVHYGPKALNLDDPTVVMEFWQKAVARSTRKELE